jgi:four helix bundle protein
MRDDKENLIVEKSIRFAVKIVAFAEKLEGAKKYVLAKQLLKAGTSIGANIREAQNAESKLDYIDKMKIAAKAADETDYWLLLCSESGNYPYDNSLHNELLEIIKIISRIISTSKRSL